MASIKSWDTPSCERVTIRTRGRAKHHCRAAHFLSSSGVDQALFIIYLIQFELSQTISFSKNQVDKTAKKGAELDGEGSNPKSKWMKPKSTQKSSTFFVIHFKFGCGTTYTGLMVKSKAIYP